MKNTTDKFSRDIMKQDRSKGVLNMIDIHDFQRAEQVCVQVAIFTSQ